MAINITDSAAHPATKAGSRDARSFVAPEIWDRQIQLLVRDHPFDDRNSRRDASGRGGPAAGVRIWA